MDMNVEEAGRDDQPRRIELGDVCVGRLPNRTNLSIDDQDVRYRIHLACGINHAAIFDEQVHELWPPIIRKRIAIRTATPEATWSRITEYGPSATSVAISTPRFIGPGCMMMASGLAPSTLARVKP